MNFLQEACALNNEGVDRIASNDLDAAKHCFRAALEVIQNNMLRNERQPFTQLSRVVLPYNLFDRSHAVLHSLEERSTFFLRHSAIVLVDVFAGMEEATVQINQQHDPLTSFYTAATILNLALVVHHEGYVLGESNLVFAQAYYQGVISMLSGYQMEEIGSQELATSMVYLSLLAFNNKMVVHYDRCDYDAASECLTKLANILNYLRLAVHSFWAEEIQRMMVNTYMHVPPSCAKAA